MQLVLDSPYSVDTHQSFQICYFYNILMVALATIFKNVFWTHQITFFLLSTWFFYSSPHHSYRISELLVSLLVCHSLFSHFNLRLQICSMKWNQICRDDFFWKRRFRFVRTKVEPFWLGASRWYKS